ncbi:MAG: FHA domain-containing protein [Pseudobdellovibrionaceae bacterium]
MIEVAVLRGPHAGVKIKCTSFPVMIGRDAENHLILSSDSRVSRHHAEIYLDNNELWIKNVSQKNFILVDGQKKEVANINDGHRTILIGDSEIQISEVSQQLTKTVALGVLKTSPVIEANSVQVAKPATYQNYQQSANSFQNVSVAQESGKQKFYIIIGVVALLFAFLLWPNGNKKNRDPNAIRTSNLVQIDLDNSQKNIKELQDNREKYNSSQYRRAQENFIKGFRDYQQGQYARARESFQVVLNLNPEHDLAKRYHYLSKVKFDEQIKKSLNLGNVYRDKKNWRLCQSHYSMAMTMLQNNRNDPSYIEAKRYFEECSLGQEGAF